jgi:hypothetical protein
MSEARQTDVGNHDESTAIEHLFGDVERQGIDAGALRSRLTPDPVESFPEASSRQQEVDH